MPIFAPRADPSSPFASMRGDHAGVRVTDLDAALEWYREKLDFRVMKQIDGAGLTWTFIAPPGDERFQIELATGPGAGEGSPAAALPETLDAPGWHHLCFLVDDLDGTLTELRRRGVAILAGPMDFTAIARRGAFFQDPWGNVFELCEMTG